VRTPSESRYLPSAVVPTPCTCIGPSSNGRWLLQNECPELIQEPPFLGLTPGR